MSARKKRKAPPVASAVEKETTMAALDDRVEPCGNCGASCALDEVSDGAKLGVMDVGTVAGKRWYWPVCNDDCANALIAKLVAEGRDEKNFSLTTKDKSRPNAMPEEMRFTVGDTEFVIQLDIRVVLPKRGESGRGPSGQ